jgi:hypothetical protein
MFIEILLEKIKTHVENDNFTFIKKIMNCVNIDKMINFLDIKERNEIAHKFFGHKVFIVRFDDIEDTVDIQFLSYDEAKSFFEYNIDFYSDVNIQFLVGIIESGNIYGEWKCSNIKPIDHNNPDKILMIENQIPHEAPSV